MPTLTTLMSARIAVALATIGLIWLFRARTGSGRESPATLLVLTVLAATAVLTYNNFTRFDFIGYWDLYHYVLGSKYSSELGYYELYNASIVADREGKRGFEGIRTIRDLRTQKIVPVRQPVARGAEIKSRFSAERWEEFKADLAWFQAREKKRYWKNILRDHGYNASPLWDFIGSRVTNAIPIRSQTGLTVLVLIDVLLVVAASAAVYWAFGVWTTLVFIIAWGVIPLHILPLRGALLRLDWLAALVGSAAAMRKERFTLAGALLGYSAGVRVFPVVFGFGVAASAGWHLYEEHRLPHWFLRFVMGMAVAVGLALLLGSFDSGYHFSPHRWLDFGHKIIAHANVKTYQRSGLRPLLQGVPWLFYVAAPLVLLLYAWSTRAMDRAHLIPSGLVAMFALTSAASYYHIAVVVLVLLWAHEQERRDRLGLTVVFAAICVSALAAMISGKTKSSTLSLVWSLNLLVLSGTVIARFLLLGHRSSGVRGPELE